jgi:ribokinase
VLSDARALGLSTSLDVNYDPAERWDRVAPVLDHVDLLLPNDTEARALASRLEGSTVQDPVEAATALAARGPTVVVKLGADGAVQVDPDGTVRRASAPVTEVVDTTGAGDTFVAAYLDEHLRDGSAERCLSWAVAAGAVSTTAVGGTAGQPSRDQLETLVADRGERT